jgi:hypothetical protein
MKALLNDEGKKLWGYAFPDGAVPVKGISSFKANVEGQGEIEVYLVDWAALSEDEQYLILSHLAEKNHLANSRPIEEQILKSGLPLRASLVSCVPIPRHYF